MGLDGLGKGKNRLGTFKNPHLVTKITKIGPEEVKIALGRCFDDNSVKWGGLAKMAFPSKFDFWPISWLQFTQKWSNMLEYDKIEQHGQLEY